MGDYARDTTHLTMIEHGAYNILLDAYYSRRQPLPARKSENYRIAKAITKPERRAVDAVLESFFVQNGDGLRHNTRADREIEKWSRIAAKNRVTGSKGGRPKNPDANRNGFQNSRNVNPGANPGANPTETLSRVQSPESTTTRSNTLCADAHGVWDKFWAAYPRKTARQAARKALAKLKPDEAMLSRMLAAIQKHKASEQWRRGVIPHASTWLNQRRWEDELAAKAIDTSCRRLLRSGEQCGMPGKPHAVYGYSCDHCNRKDEEAKRSHRMPPAVREELRKKGML
jgi:uncharacterized protein YdaU (DUF1376 family)